jgi:hypothetical protein
MVPFKGKHSMSVYAEKAKKSEGYKLFAFCDFLVLFLTSNYTLET